MKLHNHCIQIVLMVLVSLLLASCGSDDGDNTTPPQTLPPENTQSFDVNLGPQYVVAGSDSEGSATAELTLNLDTDEISGDVELQNITATDVELRSGFAGEIGGLAVALESTGDTTWSIPDDTMLNDAQKANLNNGSLHLLVSTEAMPDGAIRGQILPEGIVVINTTLSGEQEVPPVQTDATGKAALTIDTEEQTLAIHVNTMGLDTANASHIHREAAGANGPISIGLMQDPDNVRHWFAENVELDASDMEDLNSGYYYVNVHSPEHPPGEIRGQVLPEGIEVTTTTLTGIQEVPRIQTDATGKAALTIDTDELSLTIHVNTMGLDTANASHIHRGLAGTNGPVSIGLMQDPDNVRHWFTESVSLEVSDMEDLNNGYYYVNVHSPEHPPGEIRGQVPGDNVDIVFTQLTGDDVVPPVTTDNYGILASTISLVENVATFHLNNIGLDDATGASLRQASVGQNGPIAINLTQDTENFSHWFAEDAELTDDQSTALFNQGLYATVYTPAFPGPRGEVRGQIEPEGSSMGSGDNFEVTATNPADGATVDSFPTTVTVTFNAEPTMATADQFTLEASGGDSSFGDGNEIEISIIDVSISDSTVSLDFTGVMANDDTYQLTVSGSGDSALTDTQGRILDGDGDGTAGGDMMSTFTLVAVEEATTLTEVQEVIFTPTCAVSGCHTGGSPAAGQNLSEGQSFDNLVNVPSSQDSSLTLVIPGDPDNSLLVQKVEGTQPIGSRMPLGGAPLSNAEIQTIRDWIEAGAEEN